MLIRGVYVSRTSEADGEKPRQQPLNAQRYSEIKQIGAQVKYINTVFT